VIDALSNELPSLVRDTMQPAHISLWLRPDLPLRGSGETRVGRLAQCFVHPVDSVPAHRIHPVGVAVEGELVAGVPGEVLDIRQVCPSPEQYGEAAMPLLAPLDPNLTLTRTQCPAITSNTRNRKPIAYAGFANACNAQQPLTAHS
jgi:hypothetical protein